MPFQIVNPVLEVPSSSKVDIQHEAVEILNTANILIMKFEHSPEKHYSIIFGEYRGKFILHDVHQKVRFLCTFHFFRNLPIFPF